MFALSAARWGFWLVGAALFLGLPAITSYVGGRRIRTILTVELAVLAVVAAYLIASGSRTASSAFGRILAAGFLFYLGGGWEGRRETEGPQRGWAAAFARSIDQTAPVFRWIGIIFIAGGFLGLVPSLFLDR